MKTWSGRTIIAKFSPQQKVKDVKKQLEEKTNITKDQQHLVSQRRVLMDKKKMKECKMNEKETIEMTALLIGGTKNKERSSASKKEERETKRKASKPCIDVSFPEEDKSTSAASEGDDSN